MGLCINSNHPVMLLVNADSKNALVANEMTPACNRATD